MQRFNIVHGDTTNTGGTAFASQIVASYMGKNLVMVGDLVTCPRCKSSGYIAPDGPRLQRSFMGKQPALNNDLCMCKCQQKPRLINSLSLMGETIEGEEVVRQGYGAWIGRDETDASQQFDEQAHLHDGQGNPLINMPYTIKKISGEIIHGTTDSSGLTERLTTKSPEPFEIFVGHREDL